MSKKFYSLCAVGGAVCAAGATYLFTDKPATGKPHPGPSIMIDEIRGAPGDGNTALRNAFGIMLENANIVQSDTLAGCTLAVSAEVSTLRLGNNQKISIIWQVMDSNGGRIAEISQLNNVDYGALDGAWGTDASLAARGAWDGIKNIVKQPRPGCA